MNPDVKTILGILVVVVLIALAASVLGVAIGALLTELLR